MGSPVVVRSGGARVSAKASVKPIVARGGSATVVKIDNTVVKSIGGPQGPPGTNADSLVQAGAAIPAMFTGSPLTATVTLPTPYLDANYSVATQVSSVSGRIIPTNVVKQTATGFEIELCSQNLDGLEAVRWQTTPYN